MLTLLLTSMLTLAFEFGIRPVKAEPRTWTVDDDGPANFSKIQDAVNAASSEDTIYVKAGRYFEHVTVNKNLSIIGENRTTTIVDGSNTGTVFYVNTASVTIKEFTVTHGNDTGIYLYRSNNSLIMGNNVTQNVGGIMVLYSSNCTVNENLVENNKIARGIIFTNTRDFTASNNYVYGNKYGINANVSTNGLITQNKVYENEFDGIGLQDGSTNVRVVENYVKSSVLGAIGIWVESAYGNLIYDNNIVNNSVQAGLANSTNRWDNGVEGNYWSNYIGVDNDHDGLGDTPHVIDGSNRDNYPLMGPFSAFSTSLGYDVNAVSNSSVQDFQFFESNNTMTMYVSNASSTQLFGFIRMSISKGVTSPPYNVTIDDGLTAVLNFNGTIYDTYTNRWIYFAYSSSARKVVIQGYRPLDIRPPTISILSPQNKVYSANNVALNFTVSEPTSWIGYSLNDQPNVTIVGNTTLPYGLSDGPYSITIYANDTFGNMGHSNTVRFTIDTLSPNVDILSPVNKTYATSSNPLIFVISEPALWIGYSLDNQINVTIEGNITLPVLPDGLHSLIVCANDTAGNVGSSGKVYFSIDTTSPSIAILSPKSKTYETVDVPLAFSVNESVLWMAYSLDNNANVTVTGNTTLSGLSYGPHSIILYAKDAAGNTGASEITLFIVSKPQTPFPTGIVAAAVIAGVGTAFLVYFYFAKVKKTTNKDKQ